MHYIPNTKKEIIRAMLEEIGVREIEDLFSDIPDRLKLNNPPEIGDPLDEITLYREAKEVLSKNMTTDEFLSFLGGGVWNHYIPAVVDEIASKQEFYTAYTPYQPEISQGALQAIFEYQSLIAELTGMDVVSASHYDWSTALAEAALMSMRINHRRKHIISTAISPERLCVLRTYLSSLDASIIPLDYEKETGFVDLDDLKRKIDDDTCMVYVENPNFFGVIDENITELAEIVHEKGAILVIGVNTLSLGILKPPGEYGADIVVGEGQQLGMYQSFGGPLLGIIATRFDRRFVRQMPGRLIGMTWSKKGVRGYAITLQTREQHIRRERATSNITTNESLMAIRAAVYLALLGKDGLKSLCEKVLLNTAYLVRRLNSIEGLEAPVFRSKHFQEFLVRSQKKKWSEIQQQLLKRGILAGISLKERFPGYFDELGETALLATTEIHTKADLDRLVGEIQGVVA